MEASEGSVKGPRPFLASRSGDSSSVSLPGEVSGATRGRVRASWGRQIVGWLRSGGPRRAGSSQASAEGVNAAAAPPHPLRVRSGLAAPDPAAAGARGGGGGRCGLWLPAVGSGRARAAQEAGGCMVRLVRLKTTRGVQSDGADAASALAGLGRVPSLNRGQCGHRQLGAKGRVEDKVRKGTRLLGGDTAVETRVEGDPGRGSRRCSGAEARREKRGEARVAARRLGLGRWSSAVLGRRGARAAPRAEASSWSVGSAGREAESSGKAVALSPGRRLERVKPGAERARALGFGSPRCLRVPRPGLASGRYSMTQ